MNPIKNKHGEAIDVTLHPGERDDCLVILGHGVTGNKDRPLMIAVADAVAEKGYPALRMSFSGNGNSEGAFTDSTITKEVSDLTAVIDQIGHGKKIAYIGHSMGGAVAALTAARDERLRVLVSLAGMVDTKEFCDREFGDVTPDQGFMWDEEDYPLSQKYVDDMHAISTTIDAAKEIRTPWLLLHGTEDDVVLPKDSEDLEKVLRGPKKLVHIEGAGHSFEDHYSEVTTEVTDWLDQHLS